MVMSSLTYPCSLRHLLNPFQTIVSPRQFSYERMTFDTGFKKTLIFPVTLRRFFFSLNPNLSTPGEMHLIAEEVSWW